VRKGFLLVVPVVVLVAAVIWFDLQPVPRIRFALGAREYQSAASWVLAHSDAPDDTESVAVRLPSRWRHLTRNGYAQRLTDTTGWVFFAKGGSETIPSGYLFSVDPHALPESMVPYGDPKRLSDTWWYGSMDAGPLEAGYGP